MNRRAPVVTTVGAVAEFLASLGLIVALFLVQERSPSYWFCWIFLAIYTWIIAIRRHFDHD